MTLKQTFTGLWSFSHCKANQKTRMEGLLPLKSYLMTVYEAETPAETEWPFNIFDPTCFSCFFLHRPTLTPSWPPVPLTLSLCRRLIEGRAVTTTRYSLTQQSFLLLIALCACCWVNSCMTLLCCATSSLAVAASIEREWRQRVRHWDRVSNSPACFLSFKHLGLSWWTEFRRGCSSSQELMNISSLLVLSSTVPQKEPSTAQLRSFITQQIKSVLITKKHAGSVWWSRSADWWVILVQHFPSVSLRREREDGTPTPRLTSPLLSLSFVNIWYYFCCWFTSEGITY